MNDAQLWNDLADRLEAGWVPGPALRQGLPVLWNLAVIQADSGPAELQGALLHFQAAMHVTCGWGEDGHLTVAAWRNG